MNGKKKTLNTTARAKVALMQACFKEWKHGTSLQILLGAQSHAGYW